MKQKIFLSIVMLLGSAGLFIASVMLSITAFSQPSGLFISTTMSAHGSSGWEAYLALLAFILGLGILVFVKQYWRGPSEHD